MNVLRNRLDRVREFVKIVEEFKESRLPIDFPLNEAAQAFGSGADRSIIYRRLCDLIIESRQLYAKSKFYGIMCTFIEAALAWVVLTTVNIFFFKFLFVYLMRFS